MEKFKLIRSGSPYMTGGQAPYVGGRPATHALVYMPARRLGLWARICNALNP